MTKPTKGVPTGIIAHIDHGKTTLTALAMLAAAPEQPAPQPLLSGMDRAVLTMPIDLAMSDELSRTQFYDRVQWLVERIDEQQAAPELPAQAGEVLAWITEEGDRSLIPGF